MRGLIANDGLIDSIYVYRIEDKQVLTRSGLVKWEDFADKGFIEQALASPEYQGWSSIRPFHEMSTEDDKQVISMYKRQPLPFGTEGFVVINVNMYAVERMIRSMNNDKVTFLTIRDEAGQLVFSTLPSIQSGEDQENGKVLNRIELRYAGMDF